MIIVPNNLLNVFVLPQQVEEKFVLQTQTQTHLQTTIAHFVCTARVSVLQRPPKRKEQKSRSDKRKDALCICAGVSPISFPPNDGRERRAKESREKISIVDANLNHRSKLRCATSAILAGDPTSLCLRRSDRDQARNPTEKRIAPSGSPERTNRKY